LRRVAFSGINGIFAMLPVKQLRLLSPPVILVGVIGLAILVGTVLLRLPLSHDGAPIGWLDALFTATSAVCVTGLVVVDTGTQFSFLGELVILALIQIGGLGIMTIGTTVLLALGQSATVSLRHLLSGMAGHRKTVRPKDILLTVFGVTMIAEAAGAALLFFPFSRSHPIEEAVWLAVFHSVSAFCNAGFGLWPDSLMRYAGDPTVNLTVIALITLGGLGFVVLLECSGWLASRLRRAGPRSRLSLHSKIVLSGSAVAVLVGALLFGILESANVLAKLPWGERVLIATFQSVTVRTAGFNTVDIGALTNPTLLVFIALMFIGGGPGSTAGGIKVTTAATMTVLVVQRLRGSREIHMFGRGIGQTTIQRAVTLSVLASVLIAAVVCFIEIIRRSGPPTPGDRAELLAVIFEVVSGFGTVGLSMGLTPNLEPLARGAMIFLMFAGRVGPLILMDFFARLPPPPPLTHVKEELMIG
jgi:trk system potassium uptake protein TrkH